MTKQIKKLNFEIEHVNSIDEWQEKISHRVIAVYQKLDEIIDIVNILIRKQNGKK